MSMFFEVFWIASMFCCSLDWFWRFLMVLSTSLIVIIDVLLIVFRKSWVFGLFWNFENIVWLLLIVFSTTTLISTKLTMIDFYYPTSTTNTLLTNIFNITIELKF